MKINFNKPILQLSATHFKAYCKKSTMKEVFMTLKGAYADYEF